MDKTKEIQALLQMAPWDFDQSHDGWRKLDQPQEHLIAAQAIREYIAQHKDRIQHPLPGEKAITLELMYFHIGQLLAMEGSEHYQEAIEAFMHAFRKERICWNAYVSATIGFLERDLKKITDALIAISSSEEEDKSGGNIGIVKNFEKALEEGEYTYSIVYLTWPKNS